MRALWFLMLFLWTVPALAQTGPDYAIANIRPVEWAPDGGSVQIAFDVNNQGSTAGTIAVVRLLHTETGQELARENLNPLIANEGVTVILNVPTALLDRDNPQTLEVFVGIGEVEAVDAPTITNNTAIIIVPPLSQLAAAPLPTPTAAPAGPDVLLQRLGFDLNDPVHRTALIVIGVALAIMLLLGLIVLALVVRRAPRFTLHLPPYASIPPMAPSTQAGRRQGWQFHAQNDLMPPYPANEGATHIRKLLVSSDGRKLGNWQITGLRLSQYDQYGRVARTEVVAAARHGRRLSKTAARADRLTEDQLSRRVRPVARALIGPFRRRITPRSAMLPVALDLAFQGVHGEVRIRFELYYLEQGRWRLVDSWEPEMTITGRAIHENFTYSLYGLRPGEPFKTFPRRLEDDLTTLLADMLRPDQTDTGASRPVRPAAP
jgi:hypothetical protein